MPFEKRRPEMPPKKRARTTPPAPEDGEEDITIGQAAAADARQENQPPGTPRANNGRAADIEPNTNATPPRKTSARSSPERPVLGSAKKGRGGGHNCPTKDAAMTHEFSVRCFKKCHAGYCPSCNNVVSFRYGCHNHGWKGVELGEEPFPEGDLKGPEWNPEDLEARQTERRRRHG